MSTSSTNDGCLRNANTANLKESLASVLFRRKDDILIFASSGLSSQNLILFWLSLNNKLAEQNKPLWFRK